MIGFEPHLAAGRSPELLFIGAHSDDIEIGCGGTALQLAARYPRARMHWVVLGARGERAAEARRAARLVRGRGRAGELVVGDFRDGYFPSQAGAIKDFFESLKPRMRPDLIFTHQRDDLHQDHRLVGELTWNTFRDHTILEYEIPKYDGGMGAPNCFVPLRKAILARKCRVLESVFASQRKRQWFTADTFRGLARVRGIECNAPDGHAEAFYSRKLVWGMDAGGRR
ncbi:MAG: PIG-L deacetylase family protein [Steroidobacteraceae bacterium]